MILDPLGANNDDDDDDDDNKPAKLENSNLHNYRRTLCNIQYRK